MNNKRKIARIGAVAISAVLAFGSLGLVAGCKKADALIVMSEALDGLFNPFYSTAGADMGVVGLTQLPMLTTNSAGEPACGENEACVVLDYSTEYNASEGTEGVTTYSFVLKNGITFSDGTPLTMNDVLFNMYVYLDPVYTGSSTMYSTDIVGLSSYRTQKASSSGAGSDGDAISIQANSRAQDRINELLNLYKDTSSKLNPGSSTNDVSEDEMKEAIDAVNKSSSNYSGYNNAVSVETLTLEDYRKQLKADYEFTLKTFREELQSDYNSAKESFTEEPYKSTKEFDEVTSFMYMEGFVKLIYEQKPGQPENRNKIEKVDRSYPDSINTEQQAIDYVYSAKVSSALDEILRYWGTANKVKTDYISKATEVILHEQLGEGGLPYPNVSGITSLGHQSGGLASVTVKGQTYNVAHAHNPDGTVENAGEYDVLQIKVNGVDPKAIWNFGFSVAPFHYYSDDTKYSVNIAQNSFGVEWGSYDFMKSVIQGANKNGVSKNQVPLGAGAYSATDEKNRDNPTGLGFSNNNVVYFKAFDGFVLGAPKIKKVQYQVISSNNALDNLRSGSVHYVTPQFTKENKDTIDSLSKKGITSVSTWQLGYGYIGVNAGKVEDINLRKAIMSAMNTKLALSFYSTNTVTNIAWPMSVVSWAYPRANGASYDSSNPLLNMESNNNHSYTMFTTDEAAKTKIKNYMAAAGAVQGDSRLSVKFTIAGSNLTEHPTYAVFEKAAELLNECGWKIEVVPDTNALTKLSTGSLSVWAAAWGSTIDPDMYQIYHKNSTATSVLSWGYREILANKNMYAEENNILTKLSTVIDSARKTDDKAVRTTMYKEAMGYVLDLAVEMPVYQRQTLYAFNEKVIDRTTMPQNINSYTSPLGKLWEIDFVKK